MMIKEQEDECQLPTEFIVRVQKHINETVNHVTKMSNTKKSKGKKAKTIVNENIPITKTKKEI